MCARGTIRRVDQKSVFQKLTIFRLLNNPPVGSNYAWILVPRDLVRSPSKGLLSKLQ